MQHVPHQHASQLFADTENAKLIQAERQLVFLNTTGGSRECVLCYSVYTSINYRERNVHLLLNSSRCLRHAALMYKWVLFERVHSSYTLTPLLLCALIRNTIAFAVIGLIQSQGQPASDDALYLTVCYV